MIEDRENHNYIKGELVDNINSAFNHFHQKYNKDKEEFCVLLFNQTDKKTLQAKKYFEDFAESMNRKKMQSKIIFLFYIAKRMRNKFFHGIKSIDEVKENSKEFEKISAYLISIISLIESYE